MIQFKQFSNAVNSLQLSVYLKILITFNLSEKLKLKNLIFSGYFYREKSALFRTGQCSEPKLH